MNGSTVCYQHCSNGITMCVQNQWAFLKVEILNGFKWSISRRVKRQEHTHSEEGISFFLSYEQMLLGPVCAQRFVQMWEVFV